MKTVGFDVKRMLTDFRVKLLCYFTSDLFGFVHHMFSSLYEYVFCLGCVLASRLEDHYTELGPWNVDNAKKYKHGPSLSDWGRQNSMRHELKKKTGVNKRHRV